MRRKGKIQSWNEERGFGFIAPSAGGKDVFLHISALSNRNRRPEVGQTVSYTLSADKQGRLRAIRATLPGDRLTRTKRRGGMTRSAVIVTAFFTFMAYSAISEKIPAMILWMYLGVSLITFVVYAFDKSAAKAGAWRTSEGSLHWLSVVGGWPGALIAQQTLRHKSNKQSFRSVFWITALLNLGVLAWIFTPAGASAVHSLIGEGQSLFSSEQRATIRWTEPHD